MKIRQQTAALYPNVLYRDAAAAIEWLYGSRDFALRDPDGNLWSFGTYRPRVHA
jgi:uncharacterized glyoxalase superfamily protein PhnB